MTVQGILLGLSNTAGVLAGVIGTYVTGRILQSGEPKHYRRLLQHNAQCIAVQWIVYCSGNIIAIAKEGSARLLIYVKHYCMSKTTLRQTLLYVKDYISLGHPRLQAPGIKCSKWRWRSTSWGLLSGTCFQRGKEFLNDHISVWSPTGEYRIIQYSTYL